MFLNIGSQITLMVVNFEPKLTNYVRIRITLKCFLTELTLFKYDYIQNTSSRIAEKYI